MIFWTFAETRRLLIPCVLCLNASAALAAPLDKKQLPAETKWFVHVDLDAARQSTLGKFMRDTWLAQPDSKDQIQQFQDATGANLLTDLHGLTIFNTSFQRNVGVVIVQAKFDKSKLLDKVATLPDHATSHHGSYELHSWTDPNSSRKTVGVIRGEDIVVIGPSESAVGDELGVLDGKADALAGKESRLNDRPPEGVFVEAAATGISAAKDLPTESPIIRQSDDIMLSVAEREGQTTAVGQLAAKSADVADQVRSTVEGLRAMVQLKSDEDSAVTRLLKPLKVHAEDKIVHVEWSMASKDVVKEIREQAAKAGHPLPSAEDK